MRSSSRGESPYRHEPVAALARDARKGWARSATLVPLGNAAAPDSAIMDYAATHDFIVLTSDLDFSAILAATGGQKPSVVQIRAGNLDPDRIGDHILSALAQSAEVLPRVP